MLYSFFNSIKYVGHLFPVAVFRMFIGYFYLHEALEKLSGDFLVQPRLARTLSQLLEQSLAPLWYKSLFIEVIIPYWQIFAYWFICFEILAGLSFLLGFFVRPVALLGALLSLSMIILNVPSFYPLFHLSFFVFFTIGLLGGGRCMGVDYFFYKRYRSIWW